MKKKTAVVIPALNEEDAIAEVIRNIPDTVETVIVVDNGSSDATPQKAAEAGAVVLHEEERGYGAACLKGIALAKEQGAEIIVFLDGDYSDYPEELSSLIEPILGGEADFVVGSRVRGEHEPGALLPQAVFGNWLASFLIRLFWGYRFTDLGPFRAITTDALDKLHMADRNYGWTVEMQIKAAKLKIPTKEIPVRYRKRIGKSKVTGTIGGTFKASVKILYVLFRSMLRW